MKTDDTKPPIKWNGAKNYRIAEVETLLAGRDWADHHYFEPCIGGGAIFWRFAGRFGQRAIADACPELINFYLALRDRPDDLVEALRAPDMWYRGIADPASKAHFHAMRDRYGKGSPVERAATFLFLNKTAINGLHRLNRAGKNNAGPGSYVDPIFCDEPVLRSCSAALQGTPIVRRPVDKTLGYVAAGKRNKVLMVVDPPYDSESGGFTSYSGRFGRAEQAALAGSMLATGRKFVYFNADTDYIRSLFAGSDATLSSLPLRHKVGPASARGRTGGELMIHNL